MSKHGWLAALMAFLLASASYGVGADDMEALLSQARSLAGEGKLPQAVQAATKAIELAPTNSRGYWTRGHLLSRQGDHEAAIEDFDAVLKLDPPAAEVYEARGSEEFKRGHIDRSIADFDRQISLRPADEPGHWKRGISYYYARRYADGRKQFEGYQTVDDNDVENAVWRYLCMARETGVPAARDSLLKIKADARVPMMAVYALYGGKATTDDVLAAARAGEPTPAALSARLFYANLYLGLYYEAAGDRQRALEHIVTAAEKYKVDHYMWDVARVHADRLRAKP